MSFFLTLSEIIITMNIRWLVTTTSLINVADKSTFLLCFGNTCRRGALKKKKIMGLKSFKKFTFKSIIMKITSREKETRAVQEIRRQHE